MHKAATFHMNKMITLKVESLHFKGVWYILFLDGRLWSHIMWCREAVSTWICRIFFHHHPICVSLSCVCEHTDTHTCKHTHSSFILLTISRATIYFMAKLLDVISWRRAGHFVGIAASLQSLVSPIRRSEQTANFFSLLHTTVSTCEKGSLQLTMVWLIKENSFKITVNIFRAAVISWFIDLQFLKQEMAKHSRIPAFQLWIFAEAKQNIYKYIRLTGIFLHYSLSILIINWYWKKFNYRNNHVYQNFFQLLLL